MTRSEFLAICTAVTPDENGCRIWPHRLDRDGYPEFWLTEVKGFRSRNAKGHRVVLEIVLSRSIRKGYGALHTCDVRSCVEPAHLYEGTPQQNVQDAIERGRRRYASGPNPLKGSRGDGNGMRRYPERNAKSKLNPEKVREIRKLISTGIPRRVVAQKYEVAVDTIHDMLSGRTWRYVK